MRVSFAVSLRLVAGLFVALLAGCRPTTLHPPARASRSQPGHRPDAATPTPIPYTLTASDGTGLALATVRASAVVLDPVAFTELELGFDNPSYEETEGRFDIVLPPGAQVTRFASQVRGHWREAEVVERSRARQAYETVLLEQRDPALLERDAGNRFSARVYPLPGGGRHSIIVSYIQPLDDPSEPYRLGLRGLPTLEALDVDIRVEDPAGGAPTTVRRQLDYEQPVRDIVVPRPTEPATGVRHGDQVIARIDPLAGLERDGSALPERLTILFDTSASRALDYEQTLGALSRIVRELSRRLGTVDLHVVAFDQDVVSIYEGPLAGFGLPALRALAAREALGASNLQAALEFIAEGKHDRVLLISDGLVSLGTDSPAEQRRALLATTSSGVRRLDAMVVGAVRDEAALQRLVRGVLPDSGVVFDAAQPPARAAERLLSPTADGLLIEVPGATWWTPTRLDGVQPGDSVLVHAELAPEQPMRVQLAGPVHRELSITVHESDSPLVGQAWIRARIDAFITTLASIADTTKWKELHETVVGLSVRFRVLNDYTAMLVLDSDEEYERFGIDRDDPAQIMVMGAHGAELRDRSADTSAQTESTAPPPRAGTGSISGIVTNSESDEPIADALIVLQCTCLRQTIETMTNARGLYRVANLPPGTYTIQVLTGQADVSKVTTLPRGASFRANFSANPENEFKRLIRVESRSSRLGRSYESELRRARDMNYQGGSSFSLPRRIRDRRNARQADNEPVPTRDVETARPSTSPLAPPPAALVPQPTVTLDEDQPIREKAASVDHAGISLAGTTATARLIEERIGWSRHDLPARVRLGRTRIISKALPRDTVDEYARQLLSLVQPCYWRAIERDELSAGRYVARVHINRRGVLTHAEHMRHLGLRTPGLRSCIEQVLTNEPTFETKGMHGTFEQTFVFRHGNGSTPMVPSASEPAPTGPARDDALRWIDQRIAEGELAQAQRFANQWHRDAPADLLATVARGRTAHARGQVEHAARAFGSIVDLYPSRAGPRRFTATQLERLGEPALPLAISMHQRALALRPEHPGAHRDLAFALLRTGDVEAAFTTLEHAIALGDPTGRFPGAMHLLRDDLGVVAAVWRRLHPTQAPSIRARLERAGATLATTPTLRIVVTWESDATDVDLIVADADGYRAHHDQPNLLSGGHLVADVTLGRGPEAVIIPNPTAFPYRAWAQVSSRGPTGYGLGRMHVLHHDGEGRVWFEVQPFVVTRDGEVVDFGPIDTRPSPRAHVVVTD